MEVAVWAEFRPLQDIPESRMALKNNGAWAMVVGRTVPLPLEMGAFSASLGGALY